MSFFSRLFVPKSVRLSYWMPLSLTADFEWRYVIVVLQHYDSLSTVTVKILSCSFNPVKIIRLLFSEMRLLSKVDPLGHFDQLTLLRSV